MSPRLRWRAIAVATVLFAPACWFILTGFVAGASDRSDAPEPVAAFALGLALIPFVFLILAFMSQHPRAPMAVVKAMGLAVLVGVLVSAGASDGISGVIAGAGAGGVVALRADRDHDWRLRALAVVVAAAYTFFLARVAGAVALLSAPVFPFTAIGLADHYAEHRAQKAAG